MLPAADPGFARGNLLDPFNGGASEPFYGRNIRRVDRKLSRGPLPATQKSNWPRANSAPHPRGVKSQRDQDGYAFGSREV